ncbi:MAG: penicillin acylase family protein [Polyangiaceae bacterium]
MKLRHIALGLLSALVVLVLIALIVAYGFARRSLPDLAGEAQVNGLAAKLEIVRDANAVPHIFARSIPDAYFGLGYVHAQDRLWQLEQSRRVASGTLSELIGERGLKLDRLFRGLGIMRSAQANLTSLDGDTRSVLEAYARGINAWLESDPPLPIELTVLGITPAPWTPADTLGYVRLMAWQLAGNYGDELARVELASVLTPTQAEAFLPPYPGYEPVPLARLLGVYGPLDVPLARRAPLGALEPRQHEDTRSVLASFAAAAAELRTLAPTRLGEAVGSNNWLVDGTRSATGKPLLANDPHLALMAPSQWYLAHLEAPGLSVIGGTLPGLAGVILGRTRHVAWAFTNTGSDAQDLYLERLAPGDDTRYVTPDGPVAFSTRREIIHVKGASDIVLDVRETRHGPVISDVSPQASALLPSGYVLSLAWTALSASDQSAAFPLRAAQAQNAAELREAARSYEAATQNVVFADTDGAVGFVAAGRIPKRRADNELQGLVPSPGWLARFDWDGYLPFEELPQLASAPDGRIVTANQRITPPGYPHFIGNDWGPPYRADRIATLLDATPKHTLESFAAIQADVYSTIAERVLEPWRATWPAALAAPEREAVEALRGWDRTMRAEQREPLIFAAWLRELGRAVYADELGELFEDEWSERPELMRQVLSDEHGQARWCDDRRTPATETCSLVAGQALSAALTYLEKRFGADRSRWTWGEAHPAIAENRLLGAVPGIAGFANLSAPRGGDGSSVNVASYWVDEDDSAFESVWGPGYRALYDLSNLDASRAVINTGESGHVLSPHYRDLHSLWARGKYVSLTMERSAIERGGVGTIVLERF